MVHQEIFNNTSINDKEIIVIKKNKKIFVVTRTINKNSLLNAESCLDCFWKVLYYPLRKYWETDQHSSIKVESVYQLQEDSSFKYSTFVNGKKIDTGTTVMRFTLDETNFSKDNHIIYKTDTTFQGDTLVLSYREEITNQLYLLTTKYFSNNLIIKSEERRYLSDSLFSYVYVLSLLF